MSSVAPFKRVALSLSLVEVAVALHREGIRSVLPMYFSTSLLAFGQVERQAEVFLPPFQLAEYQIGEDENYFIVKLNSSGPWEVEHQLINWRLTWKAELHFAGWWQPI